MSEQGVIDRDVIEMAEHDVGAADRDQALSAVSSPPVDPDDPNLDERERVIATLEAAGWVQAKAARLLGMTPRQIAYRLRTLNIKIRQF